MKRLFDPEELDREEYEEYLENLAAKVEFRIDCEKEERFLRDIEHIERGWK